MNWEKTPTHTMIHTHIRKAETMHYTKLWINNGEAQQKQQQQKTRWNRLPIVANRSSSNSIRSNNKPYRWTPYTNMIFCTCIIIVSVTSLHIFLCYIIKTLWRAFSHLIWKDCLFYCILNGRYGYDRRFDAAHNWCDWAKCLCTFIAIPS